MHLATELCLFSSPLPHFLFDFGLFKLQIWSPLSHRFAHHHMCLLETFAPKVIEFATRSLAGAHGAAPSSQTGLLVENICLLSS